MEEGLIRQYSTGKVWALALNASLGSFIFGYNVGVMTLTAPAISAHLGWGDNQGLFIALFTSLLYLGAMVGSLAGGLIADKIGRKQVLFVSDLITIAGCLLVAVPFTPLFVAGRVVNGLAVGAFAVCVPVYLKEMSPTEMYGKVASLVQVNVTLGIAVSYALALPLPTEHYEDHTMTYFWIFVYGFQGLIALIQLLVLSLVFKSDTPFWLQKMNRTEDAVESLKMLYSAEGARKALYDFQSEGGPEDSLKAVGKDPTYCQLVLCRKDSAKMMRMGVFLNVILQFSGMNAMISYFGEIFEFLGHSVMLARLLSLLGATINMASTLFVFLLIGRVGRKTLMVYGSVGLAACMGGMAVLTGLFPSIATMPTVILILLYLFFFECGIGPVCWVFCGEVLTSKALGICAGVNWICGFATVLAYPFVQEYLGFSVAVGIFAAILVVSVVWMQLDLIETKGLSRTEIQELLRKRDKYSLHS